MILTGATANGLMTSFMDYDYLKEHPSLCNIEQERKRQNGEVGAFVLPKLGTIDRV